MSKRILLFPGQGSQSIGMTSGLQDLPGASKLLDTANEILGFNLAELMLNGPEEELKKTENTQPALFVASQLAMLAVSEGGFDYVAGHSLGEYSALCAVGVFSFEDGLKLVRRRGELMAQAGEKSPGAMTAVLGMDPIALGEAVQQASETGQVVVANYNSPGQTVISGEIAGVEKAEELCKEKGAKKIVRLPVSGAFHSPLMQFAVEGLGEALEKVSFSSPRVPVITNVTADVCSDPDQLKKLLVSQMTSSVRWVESIEKAIQLGCDTGLELGAGKVLMGLCRSISRDLKVTPVEKEEDIKQLQQTEL